MFAPLARGPLPTAGPQMPGVDAVLRSAGEPLAATERRPMERRLGHDLGAVRLHAGPQAERVSASVGADAFTVGTHIVLGSGAQGASRQRVLAHELVHVVQQSGGAAVGPISAAPQQLRRLPCQQTARYPGNLPHELIEDEYVATTPGGLKEFEVPGSGPTGGTGWADLANGVTREIYEIKTWTGVAAGRAQLARYVAGATAHCGGFPPWHPGILYPYTVIPMNATTELVARQYLSQPGMDGLIVYWTRKRRRRRVRQPVRIPTWVVALLAVLFLVALAIALLEPTPVGELVWAAALVLVLIGTGVLGSSPAHAATPEPGPSPAIPPPPMAIPGGGDLLVELTSIVVRDPALYVRLASSGGIFASVADVRALHRAGQEAHERIQQADPDDPFVAEVEEAIDQLRPLIRQAMQAARDMAPPGFGTLLDLLGGGE